MPGINAPSEERNETASRLVLKRLAECTSARVLRSVVLTLPIAALCAAVAPPVIAQTPAPDGASRPAAQRSPQASAPGHIPGPGASPIGPVKIGVYLFSVQELDFSKHTFHPTFEVWFRWRGEAFDPLANLHIVGRPLMSRTPENRRTLPSGENYISLT